MAFWFHREKKPVVRGRHAGKLKVGSQTPVLRATSQAQAAPLNTSLESSLIIQQRLTAFPKLCNSGILQVPPSSFRNIVPLRMVEPNLCNKGRCFSGPFEYSGLSSKYSTQALRVARAFSEKVEVWSGRLLEICHSFTKQIAQPANHDTALRCSRTYQNTKYIEPCHGAKLLCEVVWGSDIRNSYRVKPRGIPCFCMKLRELTLTHEAVRLELWLAMP